MIEKLAVIPLRHGIIFSFGKAGFKSQPGYRLS